MIRTKAGRFLSPSGPRGPRAFPLRTRHKKGFCSPWTWAKRWYARWPTTTGQRTPTHKKESSPLATSKMIRRVSPTHGRRAHQKATMLGAAEEMALITAWQDQGDGAARATLLARFEPLVESRVDVIARGASPTLREDLVQEGRLGFLRALDKFDRGAGFRLSTYARTWIDTFVRDMVCAHTGHMPFLHSRTEIRTFHWNKVRAERKAVQTLLRQGVHPSEGAVKAEIARDMGISIAAIDSYHMLTRTGRVIGAPVGASTDGDDDTAFEPVDPNAADPENMAIEAIDRRKLEAAVARAIAALPERDADIAKRRIVAEDPATLEDLAQTWNISRERVRQLETRILERFQHALRPYRVLLAGFSSSKHPGGALAW